MRWRKLGLLCLPDGRRSGTPMHAMSPTPLMLSDGVVRLYVGHPDGNSVSRIGYLDVALSDPTQVLAAAEMPVLDIGEAGTFDDNGVVPSCAVRVGGRFRLYYSGFQLQRKIPYTIFSSYAEGESPEGPFRRVSRSPMLDRIEGEHYFRCAPYVMQDGATWRMWYIGGGEWLTAGDKMLPRYSLRHTTSEDGLHWRGPGVECLAPQAPDEIGFGRPFIVRDGSVYRMWYSIRAIGGYRLGYATSSDGVGWVRRDAEVGIGRSETGWDSEMICYSAVLRTEDQWIMFYNGNGYGRTGVGVAVSDDD